MQIYLTAPAHNKKFLLTAEEILKQHSHIVTVSPLLAETGERNLENFFENVKTLVNTMDVVVADITGAGANLLEASWALNAGKQVLLLAEDIKPMLESGKYGNRLTCRQFNFRNLNKVLIDFCSKAVGNLGTKFLVVLPPEIDRYLNWISAATTMSKSEVVRKGINELLQKDEQYQAFLKKA